MTIPRDWLTEIRKTKGLVQQEVSEIAGIDRSYYALLEAGLRNPSVDTAKKVASALGFHWTLFFGDTHSA